SLHSPMSTLKSLTSSSTLFFFNAPPPTALSPLSLHDALPIYPFAHAVLHQAIAPQRYGVGQDGRAVLQPKRGVGQLEVGHEIVRSEEHTSELQSRGHLVCRLLLEKKKK